MISINDCVYALHRCGDWCESATTVTAVTLARSQTSLPPSPDRDYPVSERRSRRLITYNNRTGKLCVRTTHFTTSYNIASLTHESSPVRHGKIYWREKKTRGEVPQYNIKQSIFDCLLGAQWEASQVLGALFGYCFIKMIPVPWACMPVSVKISAVGVWGDLSPLPKISTKTPWFKS